MTLTAAVLFGLHVPRRQSRGHVATAALDSSLVAAQLLGGAVVLAGIVLAETAR